MVKKILCSYTIFSLVLTPWLSYAQSSSNVANPELIARLKKQAAAQKANSPTDRPEDGNKNTAGLSIADDLNLVPTDNEFVAGKTAGKVLMKINLWGGVRRPGIYHVPLGTDLVSLISYAGGPRAEAEMDEIRIRRSFGGNDTTMQVNMDETLAHEGPLSDALNPSLKVNDVVIVPESKPLLSSNTVTVLSAVATLASIVVAGILIGDRVGK